MKQYIFIIISLILFSKNSEAQTKETFYIAPNTYEIIMAEDGTPTSEVRLIPTSNQDLQYDGGEDVPDEVVYDNKIYQVVEFGLFVRYRHFGTDHIRQLRFGKNMRKINISTYYFELENGFEVSPENKYFKTINNLLYSHDGKTLLLCSNGYVPKTKDLTIELPDSVETIATHAFEGCSQINNVKLPNSLRVIEAYAFKDFKKFVPNFVMPEGLIKIEHEAFYDTKISKLTLPSTLEYMGYFGLTYQLDSIECLAPIPPITQANDYKINWPSGITIPIMKNTILLVPKESKELYLQHPDWGRFIYIMEIGGGEKCAPPTISYEKGKLKFSSATEGAQFISSITCDDCGDYTESDISLAAAYNISVYAAVKGHNNSDVVTATLCWLDANPTIETNIVNELHARPLLMQAKDGVLSVAGLEEGETIQVYSIEGRQLSSAKAIGSTLTIPVTSPSGQTLIVKIADKAVKVMMR